MCFSAIMTAGRERSKPAQPPAHPPLPWPRRNPQDVQRRTDRRTMQDPSLLIVKCGGCASGNCIVHSVGR
jgi:hypothetical protein